MSVVPVAFLLLLVVVIATVILLLVLLSVKCRRSKKKTKWVLPRDASLYSAADYTYATVGTKTQSGSTSVNIYDTVDAASINEPLEPIAVTQDPTGESMQASRMPLDSTGQSFKTTQISQEIARKPFDGALRVTEGAARKVSDGVPADGSENGYQELVESSIQRSQYANLYSSLPLRKGELANPRPQKAADATEPKWVGEGGKQENPYVNASTVALQLQK